MVTYVFGSGFVDRVGRLMSDKVAAPRARLTAVVPSASESSEQDLRSIVELSRAAERGPLVSTASPDSSGTTPPCFWDQVLIATLVGNVCPTSKLSSLAFRLWQFQQSTFSHCLSPSMNSFSPFE